MLLATPIPEQFFINDKKDKNYLSEKERPKYFYEILDKLPRNKIKQIDILDLIGAETFGRLASGKKFDESFIPKNQDNSYNNHQSKVEGRKADEINHKFGDKIYDGKNDLFAIIETTQGKSLVDVFNKFCELKESIGKYLENLPELDSEAICQEADKHLSKARKSLSKDRGEELIRDYIFGHKNPTFFISQDRNAITQVTEASRNNRHACIYVDNLFGFLEKLTNIGSGKSEPENLLVKKCGFNTWVTPHNIVVAMDAHFERQTSMYAQQAHLKSIAGTDCKTGEAKPLERWFMEFNCLNRTR